jgi:heme/copper-type cytochrome/quinol oxidase subunit 1
MLLMQAFSSATVQTAIPKLMQTGCNSMPQSEIGTTCHSFITTSVLLVLVLPILGLALVQLICDTYFNTCYFSNEVAGGDVVLYRHLFWFFGHPEVYVLILPGFGLASLIYALHTGNNVYGEMIMILGVWCIAVLGTFVWAHHMYTTSLETDTRAFYTMMTMMIAVPTGTKIYNYAVTLHRYTDSQSTSKASLYTFILVIFVILFSFGGATGVILGNAQVDITLHDCYYVVAHFHYVLSLGTSLSIVLGTILMTDLMLINSIPVVSSNNTPVQYVVVMVVLSQSTIFFSMHILGFRTLPRRYVDASDNIYMQAVVATYSLLQQVLSVSTCLRAGAGALGTPRVPRVLMHVYVFHLGHYLHVCIPGVTPWFGTGFGGAWAYWTPGTGFGGPGMLNSCGDIGGIAEGTLHVTYYVYSAH